MVAKNRMSNEVMNQSKISREKEVPSRDTLGMKERNLSLSCSSLEYADERMGRNARIGTQCAIVVTSSA